MRQNNSGKIIPVFSIIIAVLLLTLTSVALFYTKQEKAKRESTEQKLAESLAKAASLSLQLEELQKNNALLQEKVKEADNSINDLSDEIELGKGLREEMKKEVALLKDELSKVSQTKEQIKESFNKELADSKAKIAELESLLAQAKEDADSARSKFNTLKDSVNSVARGEPGKKSEPKVMVVGKDKGVSLDKIIVAPGEEFDGKILSVDQETNFVIINLGEKDGLKLGDTVAVYRGSAYLGNVTVTRLQPEMAAADFIPPFDSSKAKKDDQIILRHDS